MAGRKNNQDNQEKKFSATVQGFELSVTTPSVIIANNVDAFCSYIEERVKDYSPEKYDGDADKAKKARTEMNKGEAQVKEIRQAIQALNPYGEVIDRLSSAEKIIRLGSDKLAEIVRSREAEEKAAKRALVEAEWETRDFHLFSLDKIFDTRWLNKTYKMSDIAKEMTAIIERTYRDLKAIEAYSDDADTLKAHYLMCLDISDTLDYGEELKKKREIAAREAETRAAREHDERIAVQRAEIAQESAVQNKQASMRSMVAEALEETLEPEIGEYTITLTVTPGQLLGLKNYMTQQGIEYECRELVF